MRWNIFIENTIDGNMRNTYPIRYTVVSVRSNFIECKVAKQNENVLYHFPSVWFHFIFRFSVFCILFGCLFYRPLFVDIENYWMRNSFAYCCRSRYIERTHTNTHTFKQAYIHVLVWHDENHQCVRLPSEKSPVYYSILKIARALISS